MPEPLFFPAKRGSELSPEEQSEALRLHPERYTADHKPAWARDPRPDGGEYALQFASDADWLAHTLFRITDAGRLDTRRPQCQSSATWPNNPELR